MIRLEKQSVVAGMALAWFAAMPGSAATIDFERDIEPIFQRHCIISLLKNLASQKIIRRLGGNG